VFIDLIYSLINIFPNKKCMRDKLWKKVTSADDLLSNLIYSSAMDKRGHLWFGCKGPNGTSRFNGERWENFTSDDCGIGIGHIWDITADSEGNIWFGSKGGGLSMYNGSSWRNYTMSDGLAGNHVYAVEIGPDKRIWCGCAPKPDTIVQEGGVSIFDGKHFNNFTSNYTQGQYVGGGNSGLCDNKVYAITFDKNENVWLGTKGNGICKFDGENWTTFNTSNGLPVNEVGDGAAAMDSGGHVWIGTRGGGACKFYGEKLEVFMMKDGLAGNFVYSIQNGPDGRLWIGCAPDPSKPDGEGGISIYDGKKFVNYKSDYTGGKYIGGGNSPLVDNRVYTIVFDRDGNGWFGTKGGGISKLSYDAIIKR
jgi:ligand-binding sensor domain-containing protein